MAVPTLLRRRTTSHPMVGVTTAGATPSLPSDVLLQTCNRIFSVGVAFAVLWSIPLILFGLIAPHTGGLPMLELRWPFPGAAICGTGLVVSVILAILAGRLRTQPEILMFVGSAFLVITSLLFGVLEFWVPDLATARPSMTIGVCILAYSSIVPSGPRSTLLVGLLAATMAPMGLIVTLMRGVRTDATVFQYIVTFLPNYACALLAVIPARIIAGLGAQVKRARELGSYRLEELLGKGGMGEVYKATHQLLARPAAVKLIRPEVLGSGPPTMARIALERFRREAEATASLRSPHTISLYDFGVAHDGTFFFVMEMLDGLDLERLVQRFGPLEPARAVHLLRQACESLEEAHARGMIHRDVKPSNIFTCRMGLAVDFVKVLDFGLVKRESEGPSDMRLTAPDRTAGTPAYISPEAVVVSGPIDHRSDIYALGCVGYWLLTGRTVFDAPSAMQLLFKHAYEAPSPPSQRTELSIPPALDEVILSCLDKRPDARPASAGELSRRLAATIPQAETWTPERSLRWWERHHPESARPAPQCCPGMTLTKTLGDGWPGSDEEESGPGVSAEVGEGVVP